MNIKVGTVVWAKMRGHPTWPSVICKETSTGLFQKGTGSWSKFHVRFLGGDWAPSWIPKSNIQVFRRQDTDEHRGKRYRVCPRWEIQHLKAMQAGLRMLAKTKPKKTFGKNMSPGRAEAAVEDAQGSNELNRTVIAQGSNELNRTVIAQGSNELNKTVIAARKHFRFNKTSLVESSLDGRNSTDFVVDTGCKRNVNGVNKTKAPGEHEIGENMYDQIKKRKCQPLTNQNKINDCIGTMIGSVNKTNKNPVQKLKMFPIKGNTSDASDVHSTDDGNQERTEEFLGDGKTDEQQAEEFPVEKIEEFHVDGKTEEQQIEEFPVEEFRAEEPIVKETCAVRDEIGCIYQKLLDGKDRSDKSNEVKDLLTEAQNLIARLKDTPGNIEEVEMFNLLCHIVEEMSRRPDEQKFHNLISKFNFSTNNSRNTSVAKLQVVSVGKEISRCFTRAPKTKFVLGEEGEMTTQISDLPDEILRYIFLMLSRGDRKIVVLVSRWWRIVGEDPVLWRWSAVNIDNAGDVKKLAAPRINHVQKISVNPLWDIWQAQTLQKLFKAILKLPKLKEVENIELLDLGSVKPDLLARAFVKFEKLFMYHTTTTNDQRVAIFNEMAENTKIKNLTMVWINLIAMELDAGVLAKAMSGLKLLELRYVSLTNDQAEKLLKTISENDQLNSVSMTSLNLSSIGPEMFGSALAKVETLSLRYMAVSTEQSESLFREMNRNSKMKSIAITEIDISAVDPKLFARVFSTLVQVNLTTNNLATEQVRSFFSKMKQNCKLNFLNLSHNDLSHVDADDLATVVNNIEEVDLNYTNLSTDQIKDILRRAQDNTKLKKLSILGNRLLEVDPDTINRAKKIIDELNIDSESNLQDDESYIELIG